MFDVETEGWWYVSWSSEFSDIARKLLCVRTLLQLLEYTGQYLNVNGLDFYQNSASTISGIWEITFACMISKQSLICGRNR